MTIKEETIDPYLGSSAADEILLGSEPTRPPLDVKDMNITENSDVVVEKSKLEASEVANIADEELKEPLSAHQIQQYEEQVINVIRTIFDPEIPVNIYELGLVYEVNIDQNLGCVIQMTLTSPACPVAGTLPGEVEMKVLSVDGLRSARVELVWEPSWTPDMMSEAAQLELGFF